MREEEFGRIRAAQDKVKLLTPDERANIVRQLKGKVRPLSPPLQRFLFTPVYSRNNYRRIQLSERCTCLAALQWDAVNNDYQKSSTLDLKKLDTMGKVRRKEQ
jgi:hypothetical protein